MSTQNEDTNVEHLQHKANAQVKASSQAKRRFFLYGIPLLAIAIGLGFYLFGGRYVSTENAYVKADKTPIRAEVAGKIIKAYVDDNQVVKAGDPLFQIDPDSYQIAVEQAQSNLADIQSNLQAQKSAYQSKVKELELVKSEYAYHQKEEKRQKSMRERSYLSAADYDKAHQSSEIDRISIEMIKADLNKIEATLNGDVTIDIHDHPKYKAALAALNQAKLNLKHTLITAPTDGVVTQTAKLGQLMAPSNIASVLIGDKHLWIEANYTEKELTYVKPGQKVVIKIDNAPDYSWQGEVESFSPATGSEFSVIPAQNATGNWVKITQRLPIRIKINPQEGAPKLRAGLSAEVTVDTQHHRHLFGFSL
ncbi:MAG: HlyD family secretion protein [Vibrio sp.]